MSTAAVSQVRSYHFERRDALDRGRLRRLTPILEVMTHRMSGSLTSMMRMPVRVSVGELDQRPWEQYANELPEPTFLAAAAVVSLGGRVVLHFPLRLAMALVDARLGGAGGAELPARALTEIEQRLVSEVAEAALGEMTPAFSPVMTLTLGATSHLASAMFLQGPNPAEGCLLVAMSVLLGEDGPYEASLCLPFSLLLPILDALERMDRVDHPDEDDVVNRQLRSRLLATACDLSVCFPEIRLTPDELLTLAPGDVIRLHRPEGLPLMLNAGGMTVAPVVITQRGRRLACMVVDPESEEVFHE